MAVDPFWHHFLTLIFFEFFGVQSIFLVKLTKNDKKMEMSEDSQKKMKNNKRQPLSQWIFAKNPKKIKMSPDF